MKFRIGQKVLPTAELLTKLPSYADRLKAGGIIIDLHTAEAQVRFYSGCTYHIYFSSLKPAPPVKNQQLLFSFPDKYYD